ncbi:MAG: TonB-dependent receptor [Deltaproteobacteria bacterium]|nr:MAG: TonB-dependent receptor [Deltaproteobacteria bacterium]
MIRQLHVSALRALGIAAVALLGFIALPNGEARAEQTGSIAGTVEDINGAPVSGIKVKVEGKNLIGGAREVLTGADGSFRFLLLPPGDYTVEASGTGFATAKQTLHVGINERAELTLLAEVKTEEQVIVVRAKPLVDTNKVQQGESLSAEFLEEVPSGRSYQDTARFLPGVIGGGNPTINGGSAYSNQYLVDGVNTTDPTTNTFSLNFNFDAIEELQIITGGFSPEYGNVSGGVINVVTKSGSNEFHLDASFYHQNSSLMLKGIDQSERDFSDFQGNLNVGGPIIKDLLWYFVSLEYNRSKSQIPDGSPVPALADISHPARLYESLYYLFKLTAAPTPNNRITFLMQGDPTIIDNTDQDASASPESETHQDQGGVLLSLRWDGLFDPLVLKVQAAYKYSRLDVFPQARATSSSPFRLFGSLSDTNSFGSARGCLGKDDLADPDSFDTDNAGRPTGCVDDIQSDPHFGEGLHIDLDSGGVFGGSGSDVIIERTRWQLTASASYFLDDALGDHEFKLGTDLAFMNDTDTSHDPGGALVFFDFGQDPFAARITASDNNDLTTSADGFVGAVFLLDNWKIADRLLIQPGFRFEQATYENFAGKPILDFFVVSPRLSFALDPWKDGKTNIHGGYGRFYETGNLALSKFIGRSLVQRLAYWDPDLERYVENPARVRLTGGEAGTTVDPSVDPMSVDEFRFGFERALSDSVSVDATYIHRHTQDAWEDDETNLIWNQAGTDVIGSYDGTGQQVFNLTSDTHATRDYDALQITLKKRLDEHWAFNGSYTLAFYKGTSTQLLTRAYDNPRQNVYERGYLGDDNRHTLKGQFFYKWDFGLQLGVSGTYQTGGAYSHYYLNDWDGDYTNRRAPRGYDPGDDINDPSDDRELRLPDYVNFDIRAAWDLEPLTGVKLELIAQIFNLLNASTVTAVETSDTGFGTPVNYQRPFQASLGLRYRL